MARLSRPLRNGGQSLESKAEQAHSLESVSKRELHSGDCVLVTTKNSLYTVRMLGDELYSVSGGWFDRHGLSPVLTTINGCTWGGSAIKHDIVAAPGLFLEFGNGVTTSRIQQIGVILGRTTQKPT